MCLERGSRCSLLVMTRGEGGPCFLAGGCSDLGLIREQEMRSAAMFFRASLTIWNLPDVGDDNDIAEVWSAASGGRDQLLRRIRDVIEIEQPATIITFDPAHGTTQHPAHKAIGALVLEVADPQRVQLMETGATIENGAYRFFNARPDISRAFDVPGAWAYLVANAAIHASQFDEGLLRSLAATPPEQRRVWFATAARL